MNGRSVPSVSPLIRFGCIALLAVATYGCVTPGIGTAGPVTQSLTPTALLQWPHGIDLPAGQRSVGSAYGDAWIVSQPFADSSLLLTKLDPTGETTASAVLDTNVTRYSGSSIVSDEVGHIWVGYGSTLIRLDASTLQPTRWAIGDAPVDVLASDKPSAGNIAALGWDEPRSRLMMVRNGDHRLYVFEPSTGALDAIADLPIETSSRSRIMVAPNGEVAISGSDRRFVDFTPSAALTDTLGSSPELLQSLNSICVDASGLFGLTTTGDLVSVGTGASTVLAQFPLLGSEATFACDETGSYLAGVGSGQLTIQRRSGGNAAKQVTLSLVGSTAGGALRGFSGQALSRWIDPGLTGVLPDGAGGAWLICNSGTQDGNPSSAAYPSLTHVLFGP